MNKMEEAFKELEEAFLSCRVCGHVVMVGHDHRGCCSKECARVMLQVSSTELLATAIGGLLEHLSHGQYMWRGDSESLLPLPKSPADTTHG